MENPSTNNNSIFKLHYYKNRDAQDGRRRNRSLWVIECRDITHHRQEIFFIYYYYFKRDLSDVNKIQILCIQTSDSSSDRNYNYSYDRMI